MGLDEALYGSVAWVRKAFQVSSTVGTTMLAQAKTSPAPLQVSIFGAMRSATLLGRLRRPPCSRVVEQGSMPFPLSVHGAVAHRRAATCALTACAIPHQLLLFIIINPLRNKPWFKRLHFQLSSCPILLNPSPARLPPLHSSIYPFHRTHHITATATASILLVREGGCLFVARCTHAHTPFPLTSSSRHLHACIHPSPDRMAL